MDEHMEVMLMKTTRDFLEFLNLHAGENAPLGQFGYFPGACGEVLTEEKAKKIPGSEKWIGHYVYDGNGLMEGFIEKKIDGNTADRLQSNYDVWCAGHVGDRLDEMVQLPGSAVFQADASGAFRRVGYLYKKVGEAPTDWLIFTCDTNEGLVLRPMQAKEWTHWGLMSIALRYNVHGEKTKCEPALEPGKPYAYVYSSVLICRDGQDNHLITSIPHATKVKLTGRLRENWTEIVLGDGTVGWCFTKFLVKHNV